MDNDFSAPRDVDAFGMGGGQTAAGQVVQWRRGWGLGLDVAEIACPLRWDLDLHRGKRQAGGIVHVRGAAVLLALVLTALTLFGGLSESTVHCLWVCALLLLLSAFLYTKQAEATPRP